MIRFRQRKAFTIIEMVIVIAVIAILATVLVPTISGVIQNANHSTDVQFAANLNVQLAMYAVDNPIKNESDLRDAINAIHGDKVEGGDFYATMVPKSAKQGYHYWYDYKNGVVFVETADKADEKLAEINGGTISADVLFGTNKLSVNMKPGLLFFGSKNAPDANIIPLEDTNVENFSPASLRSDLIDGLYLMGYSDVEDSLLGIVTKLENLGADEEGRDNEGQDYEELVNQLKTFEEDTIEHTLLQKVKKTTIITEYGIYTYKPVDEVIDKTYVYVPMCVTVINNVRIWIYNGDSEKPETVVPGKEGEKIVAHNTPVINIPSGIENVAMGALAGIFDMPAELHIDTTVEELGEILGTGATDGDIILPNGERYHFNEENPQEILDEEDNVVATTNDLAEIEEIEIVYNDDNPEVSQDDDYFYRDPDTGKATLYLAWDYDKATLSLADHIPSSLVEWSITGDAPITITNNGTIRFTEEAALDVSKTTATITATLKNGDSENPVTDSITVKLVFPSTVQWTLDTTTLGAPADDKNVTLNYTEATQFELALAGIGYTQSGFVKLNNGEELKISYATSGDLFKIENIKGKYYLVLDPAKIAENPKQSLTVTYGTNDTAYVTETYAVTVVDNSAMGMDHNKIVDNDCNDDTCTDKENCDHNDIKFGQTYLFRVGNGSPIRLDTLFKAIEAPAKIKLTIYDASKFDTDNGVYDEINITPKDLDATYTSTTLTPDTWASSTIQFSGTGVAIIRIENEVNKKYKELAVEVVDGNNVTDYSELKGDVNSVLLNNIEMPENGNFDLSAGKYIYGNGFTFDITKGATAASARFGIIYLNSGSLLDNTVVIGATFPKIGNSYKNDDYYVAAVYLNGGTISNSYISGCRTPVRSAGGTIINSTLHGGKYGNLYADAGTTTIENLTTINQPGSVDGNVGGLGIVLDNSAVLEIKGNLTQHNWINDDEESFGGSNQYATQLFDIIFADKDQVKHIQFAYDGKTWVNTGIFRLNNTTSIMGGVTGYGQVEASGSAYGMSFTGYAYTFSKNASYVFNGRVTPAAYVPAKQGAHAPTVTWSKDEYEDGKYEIKFEEGQTATFNPNVLTATHYGNALTVNVKMDGVDYTGKNIVFNDTDTTTHTIVYSYYAEPCYDKDGKETSTQVLFEQKLEVKVTVAKKVGAPTFTFYYGTNGSASAGSPHATQPSNSYAGKVEEAGGAYYIMPNASATSANAIGSKTISGKTIYYPIVDGINVRSGKSTDYDFTRHYPIFKAVSISDNGKAYSYTATKEMPDTVTWVSEEIDSGNGAPGLNDGFGLYNNQYLCKIQKKAGNDEAGGTAVVKFSYVAENGNTYYYYVGYRFYDEDEGGACVTGDTLVTLADGTQKEIQYVNYNDKLLVWNHFIGRYETVPAAIIFNHGYDYNTVIKLNFSDGTQVKAVNLHQFLDVDLKQYVTISADTVAQYVGHSFAKQDGDTYTTVTLESYEISEEYIEAYGIISALHYNILVEGMLSTDFMTEDYDLFNYFAIGEGLVYDAEQMQKDIEQYGLYTYEDFADYLTYEQFVGFNVQYFKIAVGRGLYTYEGILNLINEYLNA